MTVKQIAVEFNLWQQIGVAVNGILPESPASVLLEKIAKIPIKRSSATRRLGAYVSLGGEPVCIRLQFAQEPENLKHTFLHEVAHACDHLNRKEVHQSYRLAHGSSWKKWARALGGSTDCRGESSAVRALHQERLKLVAVCQKCGIEFHRVRRLSRNRTYIHNQCGGELRQV